MEKRFLATLSRSQGRNAWAVIFRHPVRIDPNTGKPGLRVRQGLGTSDDSQAAELKDHLNQLLGDEAFWSLPARAEAEKRFHRRAVEIFYHGMEPEENDFSAAREAIIHLPSSKDSDYRRRQDDFASTGHRHRSGDRALPVYVNRENHGA